MHLTYSSEGKNVVHHVLNKVRVGVNFHDGKSPSWSQQPVRFLQNLKVQHPHYMVRKRIRTYVQTTSTSKLCYPARLTLQKRNKEERIFERNTRDCLCRRTPLEWLNEAVHGTRDTWTPNQMLPMVSRYILQLSHLQLSILIIYSQLLSQYQFLREFVLSSQIRPDYI